MPSRAWSAHSTALPSSLADLLGNVGTTTSRFTLDQAAGFWATAAGDIVYAVAARNLGRLAIGSSGSVLQSSGGVPVWSTDGGISIIQIQVFS